MPTELESQLREQFLGLVGGIEELVRTVEACQATGGDARGVLGQLVHEQLANGGDPALWTMVGAFIGSMG